VAPTVATDLVAVGNHTLDDGRVPRVGIADLAFPGVISHNEECGWDVVPLERIQQLRCVDVRPVVESECNFPPYRAVADIDPVWNTAELRSREVGRAAADWYLVAITGRAVRELASRSAAKRAACATGPLW